MSPGDTVAIVSPASAVNPDYIDGAADTLSRAGYRVRVAPHARGNEGSFSGSLSDRLNDLRSAVNDPEVKAILCSRGGYGCVHLLQELDADVERMAREGRAKWLVGFSDVSALHALWQRHGVATLHASMAKELAKGLQSDANQKLLGLLGGKPAEAAFSTTVFDHPGRVTARLVGGNLAVIGGLIGTPYFPGRPGDILLIEDIAEPIYKIERILYQLRLAGLLDHLGGLVVGRFTDYRPSRDHASMEEMIAQMTHGLPYPRVYGVPVGHIDSANIPLPLGAEATLSVAPEGSTLKFTV